MALTARKIRFIRGSPVGAPLERGFGNIDGTDSRSAVRCPTRGLICRARCSPVLVFFQFSDASYSHDFFKALAANALRCPGPELDRIAATARRAGVFVSLGFNELGPTSVGCLWNANVLVGDDGTLLNHHRKLVPTFWEKLTWANGDGAGLRVSDPRLGRVAKDDLRRVSRRRP
jgi:Carbon-nitrogen hydrolase